MSSLRPVLVLAMALAVPFACTKKDDASTPAGNDASSVAVSVNDPKTAPSPAISTSASSVTSNSNAPSASTKSSSSASGSASTSASASASMSASASASASASGATSSAAHAKIIDFWVFSRFDMTDSATKDWWSKVPFDTQKAVLAEAPQATLEITKDALITRLLGAPDDVTPYTVEPPPADATPDSLGTIVIKTSKGRRRFDLVDAQTMRVEELDKKDRKITLFVRKKLDPKATVSATPPPPKK